MAVANGRLPAGMLTGIGSGHKLRFDAANSIVAVMRDVASKYGWSVVLTDSYRPYETQERIFKERYTTTYLPGRPYKTWNGVRWYQRPNTAQAAVPGTSNHGLGVAIDVSALGGFSGTRYKQFASIASKRGWSNFEGQQIGEAWHWVYTGSGGSIDAVAPSVPKEEDDMFSDSDRENLNELRRFIGVIAGVRAPGNDAEVKLAQRLATLDAMEKILVNTDEGRRMLGVILGWQPPQGPEAAALAKYRK